MYVFIGFYGHLSNNYEIRKASKRTPPSILIVYHLLDHAPPPNLANVGIAIISFSYSGYLIVWLTLISMNLCFVNRKSSKSEGKFPIFRSGNPHYPKETCREFSFFHLSSRKESSIHCFLPNRVIRVRLCQKLPERFAFNVLSFDSAPAPG